MEYESTETTTTQSNDILAAMDKARGLLPAIGKNHKNTGQGWKYRGIDDVQNVLGAALHEAGIVLSCFYSFDAVHANAGTEEKPGKGFTVFLTAEYEFVAISDGSAFTVRFCGQGVDPGDKAVGKAKAVCFKYMAFQTFQIPVESGVLEDNDASNTVAHPGKKPKNQKNPWA